MKSMEDRSKLNIIIGFICGFLLCALSKIILGTSEPWDAEGIAILYYPISLLLVGVISALPSPKHFLLGCVGIYFGQVAQALLFQASGPLWFIGAIYGLVFLLLSALGGLIVYAINHSRVT